MTKTKRTTIYLDQDTADYIKWRMHGGGYRDGDTIKKIINDAIRIKVNTDPLYPGISHEFPEQKCNDAFRNPNSAIEPISTVTKGYADIDEEKLIKAVKEYGDINEKEKTKVQNKA